MDQEGELLGDIPIVDKPEESNKYAGLTPEEIVKIKRIKIDKTIQIAKRQYIRQIGDKTFEIKYVMGIPFLSEIPLHLASRLTDDEKNNLEGQIRKARKKQAELFVSYFKRKAMSELTATHDICDDARIISKKKRLINKAMDYCINTVRNMKIHEPLEVRAILDIAMDKFLYKISKLSKRTKLNVDIGKIIKKVKPDDYRTRAKMSFIKLVCLQGESNLKKQPSGNDDLDEILFRRFQSLRAVLFANSSVFTSFEEILKRMAVQMQIIIAASLKEARALQNENFLKFLPDLQFKLTATQFLPAQLESENDLGTSLSGLDKEIYSTCQQIVS